MKIFLIEQADIRRLAISRALESCGHEVYTVNDASDCLYLIKDLESELLLIDADSLSIDFEAFKEGYDDISTIPVVIIGESKFEWLNITKKLDNPIKPMELAKLLEEVIDG